MSEPAGFEPPPYPYDRLDDLRKAADRLPGGCVDLSIGTPCDPPPAAVVEALASSGVERGYPPSVGTAELREAAARWLARRFGATVDPAQVARALCLWDNSPANPTGDLEDLVGAAAWGRDHGVPVFSDECYVEFTWDGPGRTILTEGTEGVVALHSLSKRSNLAGVRVGFYAGDAGLVRYLSEVRKHAGFMVPGPVQAAAVVAFDDDQHVDEQRQRYLRRLDLLAAALRRCGIEAQRPPGTFYLWVAARGGDAWGLAHRLAAEGGLLVSPGDFYGPAGAGHVRIAVVQPDDRLELAAQRLRDAGDVPDDASAGS